MHYHKAWDNRNPELLKRIFAQLQMMNLQPRWLSYDSTNPMRHTSVISDKLDAYLADIPHDASERYWQILEIAYEYLLLCAIQETWLENSTDTFTRLIPFIDALDDVSYDGECDWGLK